MSRENFEEGATSRYQEIYNQYMNIALTRFKWTNLPYGLTSEQMEFLLMKHGQLMFFEKKKDGFFIFPCTSSTELNVYGLPNSYIVTSENGKEQDTIDADEGVVIKNNPLASSDISNIEIFCKRIDDTEMTADVNRFQQTVPKIILADEDGKLTAKNLFQSILKFKYAIFGKKSLANIVNTSEVLDTSSPFILDKLHQSKMDLVNELLTFLAINNTPVAKKERVNTLEVTSNNELIKTMLDLMYDLRVRACEEINEKFNYKMTVEKKEVDSDDTTNVDGGEND